MSDNPAFLALLDELRALHARKNADYAEPDNPYSNFDYASLVAGGFSDPVDLVFATLVGVKLARIQALTRPGKTAPRNEPLRDTFVDLANYTAIWASYRLRGDLCGVDPSA